MQIPTEYQENIQKNIITFDMLNDCLYSCNKKAKNYRDQRRKLQKLYDESELLFMEDELIDTEKKYYAIKKNLLQLLTPTCIHHETYNDSIDGKNHYYYLFYDLGDHSYHDPIEKSEINKYPNLKIIHLPNNIITKGKSVNLLLPDYFVNKVNDLVNSGNYKFQNNQPQRIYKFNPNYNKKLLS